MKFKLFIISFFLLFSEKAFSDLKIVGQYLLSTETPVQTCAIKDLNSKDDDTFCSATVVSQGLITAAHCIDEWNNSTQIKESLEVICNNGEKRKVTQIFIHPAFKQQKLQIADLAVLKIESPFSFTPAQLIQSSTNVQQLLTQNQCLIAGWGLGNDHRSGVLRAARSEFLLMETPMPISIYLGGKNHTQKGDSGGSLFCFSEVQGLVLIGTVRSNFSSLWGYPEYSVFTAIQGPSLEWIKSVLGTSMIESDFFNNDTLEGILTQNLKNTLESCVSGLREMGSDQIQKFKSEPNILLSKYFMGHLYTTNHFCWLETLKQLMSSSK